LGRKGLIELFAIVLSAFPALCLSDSSNELMTTVCNYLPGENRKGGHIFMPQHFKWVFVGFSTIFYGAAV